MSQSNRCVFDNDAASRVIGVDDILLGPVEVEAEQSAAVSDDDDVPIATTLIARPKKTKRKKQTMWTYETVAEPTGIASKYWDEDAPSERTTKRVAKQRLSDLHDAEICEVTEAALLQTTHQLDRPTALPNVPPKMISKTKSTKRTTTQSVVDELLVAAPSKKTKKRTPIQRRSELQTFMAQQRQNDLAAVGAATEPVVEELVVAGPSKKKKECTTKEQAKSQKRHQKGTLIPRGTCFQKLKRYIAVPFTYSPGGNPSTNQP